jgi:hypothetical protein
MGHLTEISLSWLVSALLGSFQPFLAHFSLSWLKINLSWLISAFLS